MPEIALSAFKAQCITFIRSDFVSKDGLPASFGDDVAMLLKPGNHFFGSRYGLFL
jgi:hypothetical protein